MRALILSTAVALTATPQPARACSDKSNELQIVLGIANGDLVTLRLAISETDTFAAAAMTSTVWNGTATLHVGTQTLALGRLDPKIKPSVELERLLTAARTQAANLAGFTPAVRVSETDCSDKPTTACGTAKLEANGTTLRIGSLRTPLSLSVDPESRSLIGLVRYRAGKTEIVIANIGTGDPRFGTVLELCEGKRCSAITTLHHGEQVDVAVVIKR